MKRLILFALLVATRSLAAPLDDARSAHAKGDYETELQLIRPLAEQGNAVAQGMLGFLYAAGLGVTKDYAEAVKWNRSAAEQGHAGAQFNLGLTYAKGDGLEQDHTEAAKWYRRAAEQGFVNAQVSIGLAYVNGRGVMQDYAEAVRWFRQAANSGNADAQNNLGFSYESGKGVVQDYAEAVRLYRLAAAQGNEKARENLMLVFDKCRQVGIPSCDSKSEKIVTSSQAEAIPSSQLRPDQQPRIRSKLDPSVRTDMQCRRMGYSKGTEEFEACIRGSIVSVADSTNVAAPSSSMSIMQCRRMGLCGSTAGIDIAPPPPAPSAAKGVAPSGIPVSTRSALAAGPATVRNGGEQANNQPVLADSDPILGLGQYEKYCVELGFKKKTPEYGGCVLELSRRAAGAGQDSKKQADGSIIEVAAAGRQQPTGDGTEDDSNCQLYGYALGSAGYADCRLKLAEATRENERRQREYELEKRQYDRELASINEANEAERKREARRKAQCHFASAQAASQPGGTALQSLTNFVACENGASAPLSVPTPPRPPVAVRCSVLGNVITCREH